MTYSEALETAAKEISLYLASEEREDLIAPIQSIVLEIMSSPKCKFRVIDPPTASPCMHGEGGAVGQY